MPNAIQLTTAPHHKQKYEQCGIFNSMFILITSKAWVIWYGFLCTPIRETRALHPIRRLYDAEDKGSSNEHSHSEYSLALSASRIPTHPGPPELTVSVGHLSFWLSTPSRHFSGRSEKRKLVSSSSGSLNRRKEGRQLKEEAIRSPKHTGQQECRPYNQNPRQKMRPSHFFFIS